MKFVIMNADDFGQSPGANQGITRAFEHGIVTSTSLMIRWPAAREAADYARRNPRLGVGLHLDLGEWAYRNGWIPLYQVVDETDPHAVSVEILRQLEDFERLLGRPPTHLDSHQHVHRNEPARSVVLEIAERLDLPVRGLRGDISYCGRFYGQDETGNSYPHFVTAENLIQILRELPPGTNEVGCHPAALDDLDTMYRTERLLELDALCDPRLRTAIAEAEIELKSFSGWKSYAIGRT